jgi:hypothetical protein
MTFPIGSTVVSPSGILGKVQSTWIRDDVEYTVVMWSNRLRCHEPSSTLRPTKEEFKFLHPHGISK